MQIVQHLRDLLRQQPKVASARSERCPNDEAQRQAVRKAMDRARYEFASRDGFPISFVTLDGAKCRAENAAWIKLNLCPGGWPNTDPKCSPYELWQCVRCGHVIREQVGSSGMAVGGPNGPAWMGIRDRTEPREWRFMARASRLLHLANHGVHVPETALKDDLSAKTFAFSSDAGSISMLVDWGYA